MSSFVIRPADSNDGDRLAHIGVATFIDSYVSEIDGDAIVAHCTRQHSPAIYAGYLQDRRSAAWLAEHCRTRAPAGYALICPPDLPVPLAGDELELKRIYVLSRFHGSGAGQALIETAIEEARRRGAGRLMLGTYENNHRALAFYAKHGFSQAGTRRFQVGDKVFDDIVLARSL